MGIPRLCLRLEHFGETLRVVKPGSEPKEKPYTAVIDGPSLAYHIYRECVAKSTGGSNTNAAGDALHSYAAYGIAAVQWLDRLETFGFRINSIYFDGGLPPSKHPTRLARMQTLIAELHTVRARYDEKVKLARSTGLRLSDITQAHALLPQDKRQQPTPSFLVFAILETLLESRYRTLTKVVESEADNWCARTACELSHLGNDGVHIFTSDSDLFVHAIGKLTWLAMFNDIDHQHHGTAEILKLKRYCPAKIAESHGLPNLLRSACLMSQDATMTFKVAVEGARSPTHILGYAAFEAEYRPVVSMKLPTELMPVMSKMDSRISELVVDLLQWKGLGPYTTIDMFLPVLLEDPTRASAWNTSLDKRVMVYSLAQLMPNLQSTLVVHEYLRRGNMLQATSVEASSQDALFKRVHRFIEHIEFLMGVFRGQTATVSWRLFASYSVGEGLERDDKSKPLYAWVVRAVGGEKPKTWDELHFSAHMKAALYSLRMMKQVLAAVLGSPDAALVGSQRSTLQRLQECLASLPGIAALFDDGQVGQETGSMNDYVSHVREMYSQWGVRIDESNEHPNDRMKRSKKKRKRALSSSRSTQPGPTSTNPFAALAG